jgi:glycosyltransferase involved in cell wall biosynthesis
VTDRRVILVTKTDFAVPRDGGTLRVSAIVSALEAAGFTVDAVSVRSSEGKRHRDGRRTTRRSLASRSWWTAAIKVAASITRIGSVSVARWYSPSAAQHVAELVGRHDYDAALIEYSQLLSYRGLFAELPVILDMHNVEHELLANYTTSAATTWRKVLARYETARVRRLELRAGRMTDAIVTVSAHDADMIRPASAGAAVVVAPNGVSEAAFEVAHSTIGSRPVVFIGNLGWQPNVDAAHWLVRHVWPTVRRRRPMAVLSLIGKGPAKSLLEYEGVDGITVHADVPSTLPYLSAAAVATAPLLAAGGTRLKILEAMATGTPVVATSLGAMGLDHLACETAMAITDEPGDFAEALIRFIDTGSDPIAVREQVRSYRWSEALRPLVEAIAQSADHSSDAGEHRCRRPKPFPDQPFCCARRR